MTANNKTQSDYIGDELTLFSEATNWKNYWGGIARPFLGTTVLEVGAGLGGTTLHLNKDKSIVRWVCLEPDTTLCAQIQAQKERGELPANVEAIPQFLADYPQDTQFDSILYIDVIEHIEDDRAELQRAMAYLKSGGHLIIVVPAHQYLFSKFDAAIGHYRRYNASRLEEAIPAELKKIRLSYLDSVGLCTSLANKWFLKQDYPTLPQIRFWDKTIIPISKIADKISFFSTGRSLISIWQKP